MVGVVKRPQGFRSEQPSIPRYRPSSDFFLSPNVNLKIPYLPCMCASFSLSPLYVREFPYLPCMCASFPYLPCMCASVSLSPLYVRELFLSPQYVREFSYLPSMCASFPYLPTVAFETEHTLRRVCLLFLHALPRTTRAQIRIHFFCTLYHGRRRGRR